MLDALLPASIIFLASLASAALLVWLFEASPLRARLQGLRGSDSQVLGGVAAMFALLSAFMASEVWQRRSEAVLSVEAEAVGLRNLLRIADAVGPPADALHAAARAYAQVVIAHDWPALAAGRPALASGPATQRLFDLVLGDPALAAAPPEARAMLREGLTHTRAGRLARLRLAEARIALGNWLALGTLAVLAQAALVAIHVGKRPQMLLGLGLFTLATATLLTMLALNDQPFQGFAAVSDSPFHKVLADFPARPPAPVIARPD